MLKACLLIASGHSLLPVLAVDAMNTYMHSYVLCYVCLVCSAACSLLIEYANFSVPEMEFHWSSSTYQL